MQLIGVSPMFPGTYVSRVLCSPGPMFPGSYVPWVLCSPGPMLPGSYVGGAQSPTALITDYATVTVIEDMNNICSGHAHIILI